MSKLSKLNKQKAYINWNTLKRIFTPPIYRMYSNGNTNESVREVPG